jgi:DNA-directed RNA polymerase subunit L
LKKKNTSANILEVTSKDIEVYDEKGIKYDDKFHQRIFPPDDVTKDHILITKLKPNLYNLAEGEEIDLEFKALVGNAMQHSRWSPVCLCSFHNMIDDEAANKAFAVKIKKLEDDLGKELTEKQKKDIRREFDTLDAYRHYHKNQFDEPHMFTFSIQTVCALTPCFLFQQSIQILIDKLNNFKTNLDNKDVVTIEPHHSFPNFYEVQITNETHTLLNVLQSMIYNRNIRLSKTQHLEYIGYFQPHPLDNIMVLKLKFHKEVESTIEYVAQFLKDNIDSIIEDIKLIQNQWILISTTK